MYDGFKYMPRPLSGWTSSLEAVYHIKRRTLSTSFHGWPSYTGNADSRGKEQAMMPNPTKLGFLRSKRTSFTSPFGAGELPGPLHMCGHISDQDRSGNADHCQLEIQARLTSGRYIPDRQRYCDHQSANDTALACIAAELVYSRSSAGIPHWQWVEGTKNIGDSCKMTSNIKDLPIFKRSRPVRRMGILTTSVIDTWKAVSLDITKLINGATTPCSNSSIRKRSAIDSGEIGNVRPGWWESRTKDGEVDEVYITAVYEHEMFIYTRYSNDSVSLGVEGRVGVDSICREGEDIRYMVANDTVVVVVLEGERYTGITAAN
ncbi:hypothetical protein ARMSODRAFT_978702 [Armillaria solidipes]|uniref:Uncharacterized protein n=1 Tax=Armillaria solidipes TaxID=1076256 RepID=A0A2H3B2C2_9AGAR|nr:hypothetical protein ARMSODRAFT_978702 [Armillaria solidipes]